jgi:hypothetical protein
MDERVFPSEVALLLVWLTAPAQIAMLIVLTVLGKFRGVFARPYRFRFPFGFVRLYTGVDCVLCCGFGRLVCYSQWHHTLPNPPLELW